MGSIGKLFIIIGGILVVLGVVLSFFNRIPWIGKLPGDILIKKENFTFYFPLTTSIILSAILSFFLFLIGRGR